MSGVIRKMKSFAGKWKSENEQTLWLVWLPLLNTLVGFYKPKCGRLRFFLRCSQQENSNYLYIGLSVLHWLEAMLVLQQASDIKTKTDILVPFIEQGPETDWASDDLGFPWVFPLGIFKRV